MIILFTVGLISLFLLNRLDNKRQNCYNYETINSGDAQMSDKQHGPDEVWIMDDGTRVPVNELTEAQAKDIIRRIIKEDREELDYFHTQILPQLADVLESLDEVNSQLDNIHPQIYHVNSSDIRALKHNTHQDNSDILDEVERSFLKAGAAPKNPNHD